MNCIVQAHDMGVALAGSLKEAEAREKVYIYKKSIYICLALSLSLYIYVDMYVNIYEYI
jgi:hypothetical protein